MKSVQLNLCRIVCLLLAVFFIAHRSLAAEQLVVAVSPQVREPIAVIAKEFERRNPDVTMQLHIALAFDLRQTIASIQNAPPRLLGQSPIHLLAPGDDELLTRMAQKKYVVPESVTTYVTVPLVLVATESLVDVPSSFAALGSAGSSWRVAVADPATTSLGRETTLLFESMGLAQVLRTRIDVTQDELDVVDHMLNGLSHVGVMTGPQAHRLQPRVRIVATASTNGYQPIRHSLAMLESCPRRVLCESFLASIGTPEVQAALAGLGYGRPDAAH